MIKNDETMTKTSQYTVQTILCQTLQDCNVYNQTRDSKRPTFFTFYNQKQYVCWYVIAIVIMLQFNIIVIKLFSCNPFVFKLQTSNKVDDI